MGPGGEGGGRNRRLSKDQTPNVKGRPVRRAAFPFAGLNIV